VRSLWAHTFVDDGFLLPEVREGREVLDPIMLSESLVVDFDKVHPESICIVIYLLELGEDLVTRQTTSSICKHKANMSAPG